MLELDATGRQQNVNKIIDKLKTDRQHIESMHGEINKRLLSLMTPVGVPSGDYNGMSLSLSNIWVSGILGNSNQGFYKGKSGYKGKTKGATIGSDFKINDTTLVGIAYGNVDAGFKYLHNHVGDKLKSINHVFSLYGSKTLNKLILQVTLSTSISHVKTADRRPTIFDANNTAYGKFRSYGQAAEGTLTYRLEAGNNFVIHPNISFRGTRYGDKSYTETGAGIYNRNIESKSTHELTGIIGSRFMTDYEISEHNKIVAVLNASMEYNLNNKPQKVRTKFVWAEDYQTVYALRGKYPALGYNIGGGLSYKYKNMEVLVDYNYHLRQKYHNNYYALKFKLWF